MAKKYEELTFNDDFMFCRILEKKPVFPGMIDLNLIKRGAHYSELNRSYVIYIRRFNIYKKGELHKYSFRNLCLEDPQIELGDETEKIFLCAEGTADDVSEKMQAFLNYIASGTPSDSFTNDLENEVKKARDHIKWRTEYMTFLEQLEKEREAGRAEERVNTEREKARADAAENRADAEKSRADVAESRADGLAKEILELKKKLESLESRLSTSSSS